MNMTASNPSQCTMSSIDYKKEQLIIKLHEIGAIMFGTFILKSGITSPIYIDLRKIISYPNILHEVEDQLWDKIQNCTFDSLCGVPTAAIPFATSIAFNRHKPLLMARPFVKNHGTKKHIEGAYTNGDTVLIVEDLVTSGQSIFEVIDILKKEKFNIHDVVVLLDRQGGGKEKLEKSDYQLHALCTLTDAINILHRAEKITTAQVNEVITFIQQT